MENPLPDNALFRIGVYVLYGLAVFVLALVLTFPDTQVTEIAEVQLESALERSQKTNYTVDVGDVDLWWLGVELEEVEIEKPASPAASSSGASSGGGDKKKGDGVGGSQPAQAAASGLSLSTPSIGLRLAPIDSILQGGLAVQYHLGLGGGSLSGLYTRGGGSQSISMNISRVDLRTSRLMSKFTGVPAFGNLNGTANLQFAANRPLLTGGNVKLTGKKLTIGPKEEVKIPGIPLANLTIPQTNLGDLNIEFHVEYQKGKGPPEIVFDKFNTRGLHLKTQLWGKLKLADSLGNAQSRLKMRVNFNPDFIKKHELTPLLQQDLFRNGRSGDWYGFVLWGPLQSANFNGATTPAKGPDAGGKGKKGGKGGSKKGKSGNKKQKQ